MNGSAAFARFAIMLALLMALVPFAAPFDVAPRAAATWYVTPLGNDGSSCDSAAAPCATITAALAKASSGDAIQAATGTYGPIELYKGVALSGGWDDGFTAQDGRSTLDGQGACHVVQVQSADPVTITHFIVEHGACHQVGLWDGEWGGGVYNRATLTFSDSVVRDNEATVDGGGIYNGGTLTLERSLITGNRIVSTASGALGGAGIYNGYGTLTVHASIIADNTCDTCEGGGIWSANGTVVLRDSEVSGNHANGGGGIRSDLQLRATNTTISSNTANFGGGLAGGGSAILRNCTITNNVARSEAGGIGYYATLRNTILAGNQAPIGPNCSPFYSTITSDGYNLIGDTTGCGVAAKPGDQFDVNPIMFGRLIGAPGYHPLLPGSPASDAGDPAGCTDYQDVPLLADERGAARQVDGNADGQAVCDIGAYEYDRHNDPLKYQYMPVVRR